MSPAKAGEPIYPCLSAVSTPPGVDAGPEPVPGLVPGARHDVAATTVPPARYVSAYAAPPGPPIPSLGGAGVSPPRGRLLSRPGGVRRPGRSRIGADIAGPVAPVSWPALCRPSTTGV